MGKSSAPSYSTTTANSNIWGSSVSGSNGTTYTPTPWMNNAMQTVNNNYNSTLNNMLNNDYANDANFNAYKNQLNKTSKETYDSSVLSPLANRNLMRSSGLQAATNSFNETLKDNTTNLYDSYYNRQANNLNNMSNVSDTLFNYMLNLSGLSQKDANSVSNYNLNSYRAEQQNNNNNNNITSMLNTAGRIFLK